MSLNEHAGPAPEAAPALPDLSDPGIYQRGAQYETWAGLRTRGPVHRIESAEGYGFWSVVSYDTCNEVLADPHTFSSTGGMRLGADDVATAAATGKMLVITDPPRHGMIRRIVSNAFTPRMVARLEQTMREIVVEVLDDGLEQGEADFTELAARLPLSMICAMLGVPRQDWDFMLERTMTAFGVRSAGLPDAAARAQSAHIELFLYYSELMRERRAEPREDIVSALVHGQIEGRPVTDEEVILNCNGLVSGGNETTRHATIGGMRALIENPEQWRRLAAGEVDIEDAVNEILRYTTPAMHVMRTATAEKEIAGARMHPGDKVAVWLGSANRDETKFADPDRFVLDRRPPQRHLTYAFGPHFCIGSVLATLELRVTFEEIVRRIGAAELTAEPVRMRSNLIGGYDQMPVRLHRRTV